MGDGGKVCELAMAAILNLAGFGRMVAGIKVVCFEQVTAGPCQLKTQATAAARLNVLNTNIFEQAATALRILETQAAG